MRKFFGLVFGLLALVLSFKIIKFFLKLALIVLVVMTLFWGMGLAACTGII